MPESSNGDGDKVLKIDISDLGSTVPSISEIRTSSSEYPLHGQSIIQAAEQMIPGSGEILKSLIPPKISESPNDLETWEASQIIERRNNKFPGETNEVYLLRLLYEECFSVNQSPGSQNPPELKSSLAPTPGGLISHFHPRSTFPEKITEATNLDIQGTTIQDYINSEADHGDKNLLIDLATETLIPTKFGPEGYMGDHRRRQIREVLTNPKRKLDADTLDLLNSYSLRLLQTYKRFPALLSPVSDETARTFLQRENSPVTTASAFTTAWKRASFLTLVDGGFYAQDSDQQKDSLEFLLKVRTNGDFKDIFKYISPSGLVNDSKSSAILNL